MSGLARRRGVARALLAAAVRSAADDGVCELYVHVEAANGGARALYEGMGFVTISEEPEWLAARLGRPRRLLLKRLQTVWTRAASAAG